MATWTTMTDLSTGDLVTERDMDALRGNIEYLLDPNTDTVNYANSYSTTSTSWVDVDATNAKLEITTNGGPLLLLAQFAIGAASVYLHLDFDVDGTRLSGHANGWVSQNNPGNALTALVALADVAAGSHTIKLQWKVSAGTGYVAGGGSPLMMIAVEV